MEGLDRDFLQQELVYRPVGTVLFSGDGLQAADAAPYDGLAAVIVPVNAPVKLTAVSAENHLCKTVIAGEAAFLACRADVDYSATDKLRLHLHEELFRNDRFMVALDVVLRDGTVVLDPLFRQEVCGIGLLKQGVSHVLFISENLVDGAGVPFCFASAGEDTVSHKAVGNFIHAGAFKVLPVDSLYNFGLLRINDQMAVLILGVAEKAVVVDLHFSLLVPVLQAELHVLREALTFLLGKTRHDRDQHFALGVHCVDGFFLEEDRDVLVLQLPDVLEAVESVSGKSADGLGDDHVDVTGHALVDHSVEFVTLFCVGAGDTVVCKYARQLPFRILLNVLGVVRDLSLVACFLFFGIRADAAVGCDAELRLICFFYVVSDLPSGRNDHNISHQLTSLSIRL